jgi:hypothetical protein
MSSCCTDCGENWRYDAAPMLETWSAIGCDASEFLCWSCVCKRHEARLGRPVLFDDLRECRFNEIYYAAAKLLMTKHAYDQPVTFGRHEVMDWFDGLRSRRKKQLRQTPLSAVDHLLLVAQICLIERNRHRRNRSAVPITIANAASLSNNYFKR